MSTAMRWAERRPGRARRERRVGGEPVGAGVEALEARTLMSIALADYLPMAGGATWAYEGTIVEDDLEPVSVRGEATSTAGVSLGGRAYTRWETRWFEEGVDTPLLEMARLWGLDGAGLRLGSERLATPTGQDTTWNFGPGGDGTGVVIAGPAPAAGTVRTVSSAYTAGMTVFPQYIAAGQLSGGVRIDGPSPVVTSVASFQAVSLTSTLTYLDEDGYRVELSQTLLLAQGVGVVGMNLTRVEYLEDLELGRLGVSVLITGSSLFAGMAVKDVNYQGLTIGNNENPSGTKGTAFGARDVRGETVTRTFTITNNGGQALNLQPDAQGRLVTLRGANPRQYSVVEQPAARIEAGQSATFRVAFVPTAVGVKFARFVIRSDSPVAPTFNAIMRGTGAEFGTLVVEGRRAASQTWVGVESGDTSPQLRDGTRFAAVSAAGEAGTVRTYQLINVGNGTLTFGSTRVSIGGVNASDFAVVLQPPGTLAGVTGTTLRIRFNPSATGERTAVVTVWTDDRQNPGYTFTVAGVGL
jgi:hypothetical protein